MGALTDWVGGGADRLVWLESAGYARAVFAAQAGADWSDPRTVVPATRQAQQLVRSDVVEVDVVGVVVGWRRQVDGHDGLIAAIRDPRGTARLVEMVEALAHAVPSADLALCCPDPYDLWRDWGAAPRAEPHPYDLDDIADALVEGLRAVSDRPVDALVIQASSPRDSSLESWQTLTAAAGHYRWPVAVRFPGPEAPDVMPDLPGDLLLLPEAPAAALRDFPRVGGGLPRRSWSPGAEGDFDAGALHPFVHAVVPSDEDPAWVLNRLTTLHSGRNRA